MGRKQRLRRAKKREAARSTLRFDVGDRVLVNYDPSVDVEDEKEFVWTPNKNFLFFYLNMVRKEKELS